MANWTNRVSRVKYQRAITDNVVFKHALTNKMNKVKLVVLSSWIITILTIYMMIR